MNKKRKIGILLLLIGIGIPLVLFFFQEKGMMFTIYRSKEAERKLTEKEILELKNTKGKIQQLKDKIQQAEIERDLKQIVTALPNEDGSKPTIEEIKEEYDKAYNEWKTEEKKLINEIIRVYENVVAIETWRIHTTKTVDIPFRQIVGIGVLLFISGLGFIVFSFFKNKGRTP